MATVRDTADFQRALLCQRRFPDELPLPLVCGITPRVPERIEALLRRTGYVKTFEAGEYVFHSDEYYGSIVMLTRGLGGRAFGSETGQASDAIALSVPYRIIGGNHCFFSGLPGIGRYFVLTAGEGIVAKKEAVMAELRRDTALFEEFAAFLDRLFQSDRIGFGAIALLPVRKRILLWALSWGITYGDLVTEDGVEWLAIEPSLSAQLLSRVASANLSQIKRDLAQMRKEDVYRRDGQRLLVRAAALDDVWRWLRDSEERTARFKRPSDWRGYCRDYPRVQLP